MTVIRKSSINLQMRTNTEFNQFVITFFGYIHSFFFFISVLCPLLKPYKITHKKKTYTYILNSFTVFHFIDWHSWMMWLSQEIWTWIFWFRFLLKVWINTGTIYIHLFVVSVQHLVWCQCLLWPRIWNRHVYIFIIQSWQLCNKHLHITYVVRTHIVAFYLVS